MGRRHAYEDRLGKPLKRSAAPTMLAALWVAVALTMIFERGRALELDRHVTDRVRFHAIPVAISAFYHGRVHDYTAYAPLAFEFQNPSEPLDDVIDRARLMSVSPTDPPYLWAADDRGTADYVIGAFALFGPRMSSLYRFYFVVLGASCLLFLVGYRRQPGMLSVPLLALAAIFTFLPIIPLTTFERPSLYEPRIFEMLAIVATLHIACAAWASERPRGWTAALIGQIFIFICCYHARSSLAWEALAIILINLAAVALLRRRDGWLRVSIPLVLLIVGFVALSGYQRHAYNPRYFKDLGQRVVWHNALMGFESNRALSTKYKLKISDATSIEAVIAYLRAHHDARLTPEWTSANILNSLGGHSDFDWSTYETAARDLYFAIWKNDTADALECYLVDKPRDMWNVIANVSPRAPIAQGDRPNRFFRPLGLASALIAAPAIVQSVVFPIPMAAIVAALALLLATSLIPGLMFYAVPLTMTGTFLALAMLEYVALAAVGKGLTALRKGRAESREPADPDPLQRSASSTSISRDRSR